MKESTVHRLGSHAGSNGTRMLECRANFHQRKLCQRGDVGQNFSLSLLFRESHFTNRGILEDHDKLKFVGHAMATPLWILTRASKSIGK